MMSCSECLKVIVATGLALRVTIAWVDAAEARERIPLPRPRPVTLRTQAPASPTSVPQAHDQKQSGQSSDAGNEGDCLARLRAADIRFDVPTVRKASNAACIIDTPVRLKSIAARTRAATEVRLPEDPILSCQFAEQLAAWLGH